MVIESTKLLMASGIRDLILFEINRTKHDIQNARCFVEAYQNGREQGYEIEVLGENHLRKVTFSEYRSSDSIIVYKGNTAFQGLDDAACKNSTSFKISDYSGVVKYCSQYLLGIVA
jgi:hypothetical protein